VVLGMEIGMQMDPGS